MLMCLSRVHTPSCPMLGVCHAHVAFPVGFLVFRMKGTLATAVPVFLAYTAEDLFLPEQVWRHRIGTDPEADELVYHEEDDAFYIALSRSRSNKLIFLDISALLLPGGAHAACAATCALPPDHERPRNRGPAAAKRPKIVTMPCSAGLLNATCGPLFFARGAAHAMRGG